MQSAKQKILDTVEYYQTTFPIEFQSFKKGMREKQDAQKNKFAEAKSDVLDRLLTDIPETLFLLFKTRLTDDEYTWYTSKEGTRWFANTFKVFTVPEKI